MSAFGSNPGNLNMYVYRPATLPDNAPLVVLPHGCSQDAATYHAHSAGYADSPARPRLRRAEISEQQLLVLQLVQKSDTARGSGEAQSIRSMVDYAVRTYSLDEERVYISGLSAGGAMASEMLAAYPDVFAGGSIVAGIPTGCASSLLDATTCMFSGRNLTPKQWGDLVRAKNPGWQGPWPRVAIWHGTADTVVTPKNAQSSRDQWTNVWGIGQTPARTANLGANTTVEYYQDSSGRDVVARYLVSGMGHGTPVDRGRHGPVRHCRRLLPRHDLLHLPHDPVLGTRRRSAAVPVPFSVPVAQPVPDHSARGGRTRTTTSTWLKAAYVSYGYAYSVVATTCSACGTSTSSRPSETSPGYWERVSGC